MTQTRFSPRPRARAVALAFALACAATTAACDDEDPIAGPDGGATAPDGAATSPDGATVTADGGATVDGPSAPRPDGAATGDGGPTTRSKHLDPAFGTGGLAAVPVAAADADRFQTVAVGPDGRTYAAGFTTAGGDQAFAVARLGEDGKLDPTFGTSGVATVNVAVGGKTGEVARGIVVHASGKILLTGPVEHDPAAAGDLARDTDVAVVRLDATGKLDPTFGTNGIARLDFGAGIVVPPTPPATNPTVLADQSWGLTLAAGDKPVVVASKLAAGRMDTDLVIAQLTADGKPDPAFGTNGQVVIDVGGGSENPRQALVQADGKLVACGYTSLAGVVSPVLVRLDAAGKPDATFGTNGVSNPKLLASLSEAYDVAAHGDGYVITGYGRNDPAPAKVDLIAARFKTDGSWDRAFGTNGLVQVDVAGDDDRGRDLAVLADGRVLIVGSGKPNATEIDAMAVVLGMDGKLDPTFGEGGRLLLDLGGPNDSFYGVALDASKRAVVAGWKGAMMMTGDDGLVARLLP